MEVFNSLIEQDESEYFKEAIPIFSSVLENNNLFANQTPVTLKPLVSKINNYLNGFKTRSNGLRLLQLLLPQCPQEVLVENGEKWVRFCNQIITSVTGPDMKIAACSVITRILREARNIPNLQHSLATKQILAITTTLAAAKSETCSAAFECLFEFLQLYPGQCTSQKNAIEKEILKHIDTAWPSFGKNCLAGKVFSALPLPGAGGRAEGVVKGRGQQLSALIVLVHTTLDMILEGMVEVQRYEYSKDHLLEIDALQLDPKCPDMTRLLLAGICRVANTLSFMGEMISGKHNEAVALVPCQLLGTVLRILQVQTPMLNQYRSQEHQFVAFMFPVLHQKALLLLEDILHSVGECIDLYWGILMKTLLATLNTCSITKGTKASRQTNSRERHQKGLRTKVLAYRVLCVLMQTARGRHRASKGLLHLLKRDILPIKDPVKLQGKVTGLASINMQKKSKKKGYAVTVDEDAMSVSQKGVSEGDSRLCQAALLATHHLVTYSLHSLYYKQVLELQSAVLSLSSYILQGEAAPAPYNQASIRAALCLLLCALVCNPQPHCPPPFTAVSYVLNVGAKDHNPEVQKACHEGLSKISFILANPQMSVYEEFIQKHREAKDINGNDEESDVENLESNEESIPHNFGKGDPTHDLEEMENELQGQYSCAVDERHTQEQELNKEEEDKKPSEEKKDNECREEEEKITSYEEDDDRKEEDPIPMKDASMESQENSGKTGVGSRSASELSEDREKRKCKDDEENQSSKKIRKSGVSLDEMLASFVDADPDPDSD